MEHYRVVILVLAADVAGYDKLVQSIKDTWGMRAYPGVKILYYYGYRDRGPRPPENSVIRVGDDLICASDETVANINVKTRLSFSYIYANFSFDYMFRCCAGSYVVVPNLLKFLDHKPTTQFYCGVVGRHPANAATAILFASGSGYFLSRDLVRLLIEYPPSFTCHYADDVAVGMFLESKGIPIVPGCRQDDTSHLDKEQYHYHFGHNAAAMYDVHRRLLA